MLVYNILNFIYETVYLHFFLKAELDEATLLMHASLLCPAVAHLETIPAYSVTEYPRRNNV